MRNYLPLLQEFRILKTDSRIMLTLKQLETWFDDVEQLIFDVRVSLMNLERMTAPENAYEEIVLKDGFFAHFARQLQFTVVIQLCKLFVNKDTERRNFRKLCHRLKYEKYDNPLKKQLRSNRGAGSLFVYKADVIRAADALIPDLEEVSPLVAGLKTLRDRQYAHTDPGRDLPEISPATLEQLSGLSVKIFNTLSGGIFNRTFMFDEHRVWSAGRTIEILAERKKEELDRIDGKPGKP